MEVNFVNLYKIKYDCLDCFYEGIDQDISGIRFQFKNYDFSSGPFFTNDFPFLSPLEKIIWCFTIASRYECASMQFEKNGDIEKNVRKALEDYKNLNFSEYNLSKEDIEILAEDAETTEKYLEWLDKKRSEN
jgi:hypothetical protein